MPRVPISLKLEPDLLTRLDAEAAHRGQTRTTFIERAIEDALQVEVTAVRRNPDGSTTPLAWARSQSA